MKKKKILTVDDSRTILKMLALTLNKAGYETIQAGDGVEGLEALDLYTPDVIVTDINMPRLDGFGFIEGVRSDERHRSIPILVLTTESDDEKRNRARRPAPQAGSSNPSIPPRSSTRSSAFLRDI